MGDINSFSSYRGIVGSSPFCDELTSKTVLLQTGPLAEELKLKQKATCL